MSETVIVALIALVGTVLGSLGGVLTSSRLTSYRIEQLEKKVDKHNSVIERTFRLEENIALLEADRDRTNARLKILEEDERK